MLKIIDYLKIKEKKRNKRLDIAKNFFSNRVLARDLFWIKNPWLNFDEKIIDSVNKSNWAGRNVSAESEIAIFEEIKSKIALDNKQEILDIGIGASYVSECIAKYCLESSKELTGIDSSGVINELRKNFNFKNVRLLEGLFPKNQSLLEGFKFDAIILYSVLHYVKRPSYFMLQLMKYSHHKCTIFIGDIPDLNMKFSQDYQDKEKSTFRNFVTYLKFRLIFRRYTKKYIQNLCLLLNNLGFSTEILNQGKNLPFNKTRIDIVAKRGYHSV